MSRTAPFGHSGVNTYEDVQRVQEEILVRQQQLAALPPTSPQRTQLQIEINDRTSILRTYEDKTRPFVQSGVVQGRHDGY